jgi:hypothetical protein
MSARFVILIAVALGLAVFLALRPTKAKKADIEWTDEDGAPDDMTPEQREALAKEQTIYEQRPAPPDCKVPATPPQFSVQTELNMASGKNQLCFYISEANGYYVESLRIEFWWVGDDPALPAELSKMARLEYLNRYIKARETMKHCFEVVPAEWKIVGGMGTTENWRAKVVWFNRVCESNPNPLPDE